MDMTKGDFILGVVSSLIATILFELVHNLSPQVLLRTLTTAAKKSYVVLAKTGLAFQRIPTSILSPFIALTLTVFALIALPLPTAIAPTTPRYLPADGVWKSATTGKSYLIAKAKHRYIIVWEW